jgi:hypothetical protein
MAGIKIAKGGYIGFFDPDDYVRPGFCKKLYSAAKIDPTFSLRISAVFDLETGKLSKRDVFTPKREIVIGRNTSDILAIYELLDKIYNPKYKKLTDLTKPPKVLDDMMFLLWLLKHQHDFFIPDNLICYMVRESSIVNTIRQEQLDSIYSYVRSKKIYPKVERNDIFLPLLEACHFAFGISLMFRMTYNKRNLNITLLKNYKF